MKIKLGICSAMLIAGCATAPPKELVDARAAYQRALHGPAAEYAPADLHKAQTMLEKAEQSFADAPKEQKTRDLSYIAERKAEIAEGVAAQEMDNRKKAQADQDFVKTQGQALDKTRDRLSQSEASQKDEAARLEQERVARMAAEGKAATAEGKVAQAEQKNKELEDNLAKLAAVKEEERGLVITLSGSVLFASNKAELLPSAQTRLEQVATALNDSSKDRPITVEGYTDSRGSDFYNRELSQKRAESVRSFLVSRGVPSDKIHAEGLGKDRPIADNTSAEGRANNRRVEIVIAPKK